VSQPVIPLVRLDGDPGAACEGDDCLVAAADPADQDPHDD
jgi:hypothetical protein